MVGCPCALPFRAPQGRRPSHRAFFSHGPQARRFQFATFAKATLPERRADRVYRKPAEEVAAHGLEGDDLGFLDGEALTAFVWSLGADRRRRGETGGGSAR